MRESDGILAPSYAFPASLPVSDVRLVVPMIDKTTGVVKDTIIDRLKRVANPDGSSDTDIARRNEDREKGLRIIPGTKFVIPWPKRTPPALVDHPNDTLRITLDEETFVPTLLSPPMPDSVIDELRNKYSKRRVRHDAEYVAKIEAKAKEEQIKVESAKQMETPLKEFQRKLREDSILQRSESARQERGELIGDDLLARLGGLMIEKRSSVTR
jgi:large subunit ribosomal protein L24